MTAILIDLETDTVSGVAALAGRLEATRLHATRLGAVITYPGLLTFPLPGPVVLPPPAPDDAWVLRLYPNGQPVEVRVVQFGAADVAWLDLVDVDPTTFDPAEPGVLTAWEAVVAQVTAARVAALAAIAAASTGIVYTQPVPAAQWSIPHSLPRPPAVTLLDPSGAVMLADITSSPGLVLVTFANPTAGRAVLT